MFRGQAQLGVGTPSIPPSLHPSISSVRSRGPRPRLRAQGPPFGATSAPRWCVTVPVASVRTGRAYSSPDPARRGGRAGCGGEFAHAPAADQCSQLGVSTPRCMRRTLPFAELRTRLHFLLLEMQALWGEP